jgi:hypothetical protein
MMRIVIDSLVAVMLAAVLAGVVFYERTEESLENESAEARASVTRITRQAKLHAVMGQTQVNERGHATSISPEWFAGSLPENPLLNDAHPWLEVASPSQKTLSHPPDRVARDTRTAKFWYNPANGQVRARVPMTVSDERALALYNRVNDSQLSSLFE